MSSRINNEQFPSQLNHQNHNSHSNQAEAIVISSVQPIPTTAGEVVLYRHLSQLKDWKISVVADSREKHSLQWWSKLSKRLSQSRLNLWMNDLEVLRNGSTWNSLLNRRDISSRAIVLTVAHGDGCWAAQRFAKRKKLPLVTIFHDWYPDIPQVHTPVKKVLVQRFMKLYQHSDLAICVSERIQNLLGSHPNSYVLYPIPSSLAELSPHHNTTVGKSNLMRVLYCGELLNYGSMLGQLLQKAIEHPTLKFEVRGVRPNWSTAFQAEMRQRGLLLDFVPQDEFHIWLKSADVFLVTMSFDAHLRQRMETSFPSKLLEYAQLYKPLIIWGPEYCSAVRWARNGDRALCVTEERPDALIDALEDLQSSPERQHYYASQCLKAAQTEFNPVILQQQFVEAIEKLVSFS